MDKVELISKLSEFKHVNGDKYGIQSLGLFGSFSRNQETASSDVDICIKTLTPDPYVIVHIKEELEHQLNRSVDIVRLRKNMNQFLQKQIEKDAVYV